MMSSGSQHWPLWPASRGRGCFTVSSMFGSLRPHQGISFLLWQGGLSYHGGLFAAVLAAWLWFRVKRIPVEKMVDIFAPSIALGFGIVRIGCFLNGCCFGTPTDMPWGLNFPLISPAGRVFGSAPIHPVQLYASICGLLGFLVLIWIEKKYPFG